jgi:hypothetical protein
VSKSNKKLQSNFKGIQQIEASPTGCHGPNLQHQLNDRCTETSLSLSWTIAIGRKPVFSLALRP